MFLVFHLHSSWLRCFSFLDSSLCPSGSREPILLPWCSVGPAPQTHSGLCYLLGLPEGWGMSVLCSQLPYTQLWFRLSFSTAIPQANLEEAGRAKSVLFQGATCYDFYHCLPPHWTCLLPTRKASPWLKSGKIFTNVQSFPSTQ